MLEMKKVSYTYKGSDILATDNISFSVKPGDFVILIGHNGAGKSTLFDLMGGLKRPNLGEIIREVETRDFGWCPQREIIDWSLSVRQNIRLGLDLRTSLPKGIANRWIEQVADELGIARYLDKSAESLSGGELRRVQIARALVGEPKLLILDEPTMGLDPNGISILFEKLKGLAIRGHAILISSHETSRFGELPTRVIAMNKGQLIADEPIKDFYNKFGHHTDLWNCYLNAVKENVRK